VAPSDARADFTDVTLTDVSRHFGRRRAVSRVSLRVATGEIVGLLGPNGAGKSTLLGILATLVVPTTGSVTYGDMHSRDRGIEIRYRLGVLAHELHLYPELSARQNLDFFARMYGLPPGDVVSTALTRAGLSERGDDAVSSFSRGMRQRLALERTLLHAPRLVLLDEPFTGLDDHAVTVVADRIKRIASSGTIVVLATHDLDLADGLISRAAVIREGRLVCDEPAGSGLRARYRSLVGAA
jgi:ABC-type multidrug transport system ATPase subunit